MCGSVGYIGKKTNSEFLLDGLSRLEYRGYDSAGIACLGSKNSIECVKTSGRVSVLAELLEKKPLHGVAGIGHTRWATHGIVDDLNAHPQMDEKDSLAIVHNGIFENFQEIKHELTAEGVAFKSETDTEVAANLLAKMLKKFGNIKEALIAFISRVSGSYSVVCLSEKFPDRLIIIRKSSPLVIGVGKNEMFVSSDAIAFHGKTDQVSFVPDNSFGFLFENKIEIYNFSGKKIEAKIETLKFKFDPASRGTFDHFMLKEIYEQPLAIERTIALLRERDKKGFWKASGIDSKIIKNLESLDIVAAGTSWHAGLISRFFFEEICNIPVYVGIASEYRFEPSIYKKNNTVLFISQSGETADTLEALRMVKSKNEFVLGITNVETSTIVREADAVFLTDAGPEIAVASTKAFTAQVATLYFLANRIGVEKGLISREQFEHRLEHLHNTSRIMQLAIDKYEKEIKETIAKSLSLHKGFIFLGRNICYPLAREAALKLKEISYVFAEGHAAGELKHGALAIIEKDFPVILFSILNEALYRKLISNAMEVKARGAELIVFAFKGQDELINIADKVFIFPEVEPMLVPLAMTGLMQFLVYSISVEKGCPVDKPRNLAKSVTVE
jgi:glutamine---fructose-6-phosphate transaminase (isomerizing)